MSARATVRSLAGGAIKRVAAGADVLRRAAGGVTILVYHRVGLGTGGEVDLDPATFDRQLAWLREHRRVLHLDDALDELRGGAPTGGDASREAVVLTFDDGTRDWVEQVLPLLDRHGVPARFYVATDFVERQVPFPGDGAPITWEGLRELASSPLVTIGSHTHRHLLLDRLPRQGVEQELDTSIGLLQDRLGVDPAHFCYPKAVAGSPDAEAAVRARFRSAVLAGTRPNPAGTDPHRLHRSPVQRSDGMRWFERKATGGMRLEDDLRRVANRVRYRGATS